MRQTVGAAAVCVTTLCAVTAGAAMASAQESRALPAIMVDAQLGVGIEPGSARFSGGATRVEFADVAVRVARRIAILLNISSSVRFGGGDKISLGCADGCARFMLPDLSANGATLGILLGIGPQRRPEQTTVSLGAGAFAAEAFNPSVPREGSTVLGFHGGIERAFDLWSHAAATIGFHPLVLMNLRGSTHVIASFLVGLRG